ncbi:MAG: hypothetical protein ABI867_14625 [Kofleriaceae bacterium]
MKRIGQHGQIAERTRDPQPLVRDVRGVAEHAFQVVERGHHPERSPDLQPLGLAQPPRLFGVELRAAARDVAQRPIDGTPIQTRGVVRAVALVADSRSFRQHHTLLATSILDVVRSY